MGGLGYQQVAEMCGTSVGQGVPLGCCFTGARQCVQGLDSIDVETAVINLQVSSSSLEDGRNRENSLSAIFGPLFQIQDRRRTSVIPGFDPVCLRLSLAAHSLTLAFIHTART